MSENKKLRLGIIGLGCRGTSMTDLLAERDDTEITVICDVYDDRISAMQENLAKKGLRRPIGYVDYKKLIDSPLVDAVFIFSAWENHIPAAIYAMRAKKPSAFEVGGAYTLDDCRALIKTYEETGTPVMMLENCMYGSVEMTVTEMLRDGVFGELMQVEGGYKHDLRSEVLTGNEKRHGHPS